MKSVYGCPHCNTVLNPSVKILLVVKYKQRKGMILLSPQPGNFKFICDKSVEERLKPGATITFFCPVCSEDLTSPGNKKFTEINLMDANGHKRKVEFSRIFGTHSTFIVNGDEITAYGEDADDDITPNFFGV